MTVGRDPGVTDSGRGGEALAVLHTAAGLGACPPHPGSPAHTEDLGAACRRWTLVVVCLVSSVLLFNVTAPNVALAGIARDLAADFVAQQWVLSAYAVVLAALLLAGGALGDRYGHRLLFLSGLGVFVLSSVVCAASETTLMLIGGRVGQGLGASALFPAGLALIAGEYSGAARARAIGIWGASTAAAMAAGPLLGGVLVELAGWRSEFAFGALLGLVCILVGRQHLRPSSPAADVRLDWRGTAVLTAAMALIVVAVQRANTVGWLHPLTVGMIVAALALFVAFVMVEFRVRSPLITPELLRNPVFVAATAVALLFAMAGFAPLVYITLFFLQVAGHGPILAGVEVAPFAIAALLVSLLAARVAGRLGVRTTMILGMSLCAAGLAAMLLVTPAAPGLSLLPGLLVFGAGAGLVNPTMTVVAMSAVSPEHGGMASAVNNAARQLGIALGIAALGAGLEAQLANGMQTGLLSLGVPAPAAVAAATATAAAQAPVPVGDVAAAALRSVYDTAFVGSLQLVLLIAIATVLLGVVIVVVLIRPGRARGGPSAPTPVAAHASAEASTESEK